MIQLLLSAVLGQFKLLRLDDLTGILQSLLPPTNDRGDKVYDRMYAIVIWRCEFRGHGNDQNYGVNLG